MEPIVFDATLRPNTPLSVPVLRAIVGVVALVNLAFAAMFVFRGAWPLMPFMGADVLLLAWAFRAVRIAAQRRERVTLRPATLTIEQHPARGTPKEVVFNPYWVRVDMEEPENHWSRLMLRSHGRAVQVGSFLPPQDRESLADALKSALRRLREFGA